MQVAATKTANRPMIGMRVTQEEMGMCKAYADEEVRSVASFARMLMLMGLKQYQAQRDIMKKRR